MTKTNKEVVEVLKTTFTQEIGMTVYDVLGRVNPTFIDEFFLKIDKALQAKDTQAEEMMEGERLLTLKGIQHKWFSDGELKTLEDIEIQIKALTQPTNTPNLPEEEEAINR